MKVPPGLEVLDCGGTKSFSGAHHAVQLAQAFESEGRRVGDDRKVEATEEQCHFRGIGDQVITSFIKRQVPRALEGKDVQ